MLAEYDNETIHQFFSELVTTIESVYDLRGIGVSAAYVDEAIWKWMYKQSLLPPFGTSYKSADQYFTESEAMVKTAQDGKVIRASFKPYGATRRIPIKVKYSGKNPWKVVVGYREED